MSRISRRKFMRSAVTIMAGGAVTSSLLFGIGCTNQPARPNIILTMCDDLGWGDTGFNGNPTIQTPHLDAMAASGMKFNRFYAASAVCSPTRGSVLTGRDPYRYGIFWANKGKMRSQEVTIAEVLKVQNYTTGHFGKWHLGTLTTKIKDSNRGGPGSADVYSPPWENGFDICFSTEAKVPTYDPMIRPKDRTGPWWDPVTDSTESVEYGTYYWNERGERVMKNLNGDDSALIMDRVLPFIRQATSQSTPFLAVIWFHAPHLPVVAGHQYTSLYSEQGKYAQHYHGSITAMDTQIGRLRKELRRLGIAENTMLWFCSDNGPAAWTGNEPGSPGPFRGGKATLWEGGIRVPGLLEWPGHIKEGQVTEFPSCTADYYPTTLDVLGLHVPHQPEPIDGISLVPMMKGNMKKRPSPLAFGLPRTLKRISSPKLALVDNQYKLLTNLDPAGESDHLYNLIDDPSETTNLAQEKPELVASMRSTLKKWWESCKNSHAGKDYEHPIEPVNDFPEL